MKFCSGRKSILFLGQQSVPKLKIRPCMVQMYLEGGGWVDAALSISGLYIKMAIYLSVFPGLQWLSACVYLYFA